MERRGQGKGGEDALVSLAICGSTNGAKVCCDVRRGSKTAEKDSQHLKPRRSVLSVKSLPLGTIRPARPLGAS